MPDQRPLARPIATLAAVSSLATAPDRAAPDRPRASSDTGAGGPRISANAAFGLALAAGLTALVFITRGGDLLGPSTWVEIALVAVAAVAAVAVAIVGAPGRAWGLGTLLLFVALAVLTAVSISWSVQPATSWLAANQTLSYLAAFAAALALARLMPERWPGLVGSIAVVTTIVCAYAVLAKVFPGSLNASDTAGRLSVPFSYWNATGLIAALGLPACVWAGAARRPGRVTRALAVPAIAILVTVLVLSYSRGALIAAIIGLTFWFAVVPLRLRAAAVLAIGGAGGGAITLWALAHHALTHNGATLQSRTAAGHSFGVVLIVALVLLTLAGFAAVYAIDHTRLAPDARHKIATILIVLVALVPIAGIGALGFSSRGLTGEVSHFWNTLTSTSSNVSSTSPSRIFAVGNTRGRYWNEAIKVGEHSLLHGVGAAGFATAAPRYANDYYATGYDYAHGYLVETFADFGLIGLALTLALLVSWCVAAARTIGAPPRPLAARADSPAADDQGSAERVGLLTMAAIVLDLRPSLDDRLDLVRARHGGHRARLRRLARRPRAAVRADRAPGPAPRAHGQPGRGGGRVRGRARDRAVRMGDLAAASLQRLRRGRDRRLEPRRHRHRTHRRARGNRTESARGRAVVAAVIVLQRSAGRARRACRAGRRHHTATRQLRGLVDARPVRPGGPPAGARAGGVPTGPRARPGQHRDRGGCGAGEGGGAGASAAPLGTLPATASQLGDQPQDLLSPLRGILN